MMNNDGSNGMEQITKVVSHVKDGLLAVYYRDNEERASEVCRQDGLLWMEANYRNGRLDGPFAGYF